MSFLNKLLGGEVVSAAQGVANVINQFVETPDERRAADMLLTKMAQEPDKAQTEINKVESGHRSIFVAGWRPFIGWVCGTSLGLYFIPQFVLGAILWVRVSWDAQEIQAYPVDASALFELVLAMLGMSGLRMIEKIAGKAK
jgi:hypothetical protein